MLKTRSTLSATARRQHRKRKLLLYDPTSFSPHAYMMLYLGRREREKFYCNSRVSNVVLAPCQAAPLAMMLAEEQEEDLFVFNDTIEGPRAPAV